MTTRIVFILTCLLFLCMAQITSAQDIKIENRTSISQYGITWTFDKPAKTGQFMTCDWWVIGPVTDGTISPTPGNTISDTVSIKNNSRTDTSLKSDATMRNGSMIVLKAGRTQGYDSRSGSFRKRDGISL